MSPPAKAKAKAAPQQEEAPAEPSKRRGSLASGLFSSSESEAEGAKGGEATKAKPELKDWKEEAEKLQAQLQAVQKELDEAKSHAETGLLEEMRRHMQAEREQHCEVVKVIEASLHALEAEGRRLAEVQQALRTQLEQKLQQQEDQLRAEAKQLWAKVQQRGPAEPSPPGPGPVSRSNALESAMLRRSLYIAASELPL